MPVSSIKKYRNTIAFPVPSEKNTENEDSHPKRIDSFRRPLFLFTIVVYPLLFQKSPIENGRNEAKMCQQENFEFRKFFPESCNPP